MANSIKHTVVESLTWLAAARFFAQMIRWASSLTLARLLAPSDYNIVLQAEIALGLIELFTALGLGGAFARKPNMSQAEKQAIFGAILLADTVLATCLFFMGGFLADFYQQPELRAVMTVQAMAFILSAFEVIPSTMLALQMRFKSFAMIQVLSGVIGALTAIVLAFNDAGYWAIVLGGVSMQLTRVIAVNILQPTFLLPKLNFGVAAEHIKFGGIYMVANILWYVYVNCDVYIARNYWDATTAGFYAFALQMAAFPLNKIMPPLKQVALPAYSKARTDQMDSRPFLIKSLRLCLGVGFPLFAGLAAVTPLLVTVVLDEQWVPAINAMTLLFLMMPFRMFLELHQPAVALSGNPKMLLTNEFMICSLMVPAFFVAAHYSPTVLAAVWLGMFPALTIYSSFKFCKVLEVDFGLLMKSIVPALLASLSMFALVRFSIYGLGTVVADWLNLVLVIAIGAGFYLTTIFLVDRNAFKEYLGLVRR